MINDRVSEKSKQNGHILLELENKTIEIPKPHNKQCCLGETNRTLSRELRFETFVNNLFFCLILA